jgi:hypothetical protein
VLKRCLPTASWGVTVAVAVAPSEEMSVSEDVHVINTDICRSHVVLYHRLYCILDDWLTVHHSITFL